MLGALAAADGANDGAVGEIKNSPGVPTDAIKEAGHDIQAQVFTLFGDVLPYGVAAIGLAWGYHFLKKSIGARSAKV